MPIPAILGQPNKIINYTKPYYPRARFLFDRSLQADYTAKLIANFTRASTAYKQDGTEADSGVPRYETGQFAQAVMIEEGTTNLFTANQASVETDTTGFSLFNTATLTRDTTKAWHGTASLKVVTGGLATYDGVAVDAVSASPGLAYTASLYISGSNQLFLTLQDNSTGSFTDIVDSVITPTTAFGRFSITGTVRTGTTQARVIVATPGVAEVITFWLDGLQIEQKAYAPSWQLPGSARAAETLIIPTAGVLSGEGTIEKRIYLTRSPGTNEQYIFDGAGAANQNLQVVVNTNGTVRVVYGTGAAEVTVTSTTVLVKETWYAVAWKWSSSGVSLLINGVAEGSNATAPGITFGANAYIGSKADETLQLDGLTDNLSISLRAHSNEEILDAFRNGER